MPADIVIGYHGTTSDRAASIVGDGFLVSTAAEDWLGEGAYFFQDAPLHALEWAKQRYGQDIAVVRSEIQLDGCMDLLDIGWESRLRTECRQLERAYAKRGEAPPRQGSSGANVVDREIIDLVVRRMERRKIFLRCVRAAFIEGEPIFPSSAIYDRAHVQIAVRDTSLILTREWPTL